MTEADLRAKIRELMTPGVLQQIAIQVIAREAQTLREAVRVLHPQAKALTRTETAP